MTEPMDGQQAEVPHDHPFRCQHCGKGRFHRDGWNRHFRCALKAKLYWWWYRTVRGHQ